MNHAQAKAHLRLAEFYVLNRKKMVAEGLYRQALDNPGPFRSTRVNDELKNSYGKMLLTIDKRASEG